MKFKVNFNTRNLNKVFGNFSDDVRFMCERTRPLDQCDERVVNLLTNKNLAKVTYKGYGWPAEISIDFSAMTEAKLVNSWDVN